MRAIALCAALAAVALFAVPCVRVLTPAAAADDKDKEKKEKEEKERKERERKRREKALRAIGGQFGAKDTSWLLDRVPKDQKLTLSLATGKGDVDYSLDQARSVLQKYFDDLKTLDVATTSEDAKLLESSGSFPMTFRRNSEKKDKSATLYVTISGLDSTANGLLTKLSVEAQ